MTRYLYVIERTQSNYSAYVPDLPGCVATGNDIETVEKNIKEAISFHIEGMKEDKLDTPNAQTMVGYASC